MPRVYQQPFSRSLFNEFCDNLNIEEGNFRIGVTLKKYTKEELQTFVRYCIGKINELNADPETNTDALAQINSLYQHVCVSMAARRYRE